MEIEEVKVVWIKVIPSIRELIDVCELTDYVEEFFAKSSIQKVKAQNTQSGGVIAADYFFEEAQRKPRSFPVILASLKRTKQSEVLIEILKTVIKEVKEERHDAIFDLVRRAARELRYPVDVEGEIREAQGCTLYYRHQHRTEVSNIVDGAQVNYLEAGRNTHNNQRSHSPQTDQYGPVQPASPDSNLPEVVPNTRPSVVPSPTEVIYQRRQPSGQIRDTPDVKLRVMKASARMKISIKLEKPSPDGDAPVWSLLLDLEDLEISAEESSDIEKSKNPGKDFYDKLAQRDYTSGMLIDMLEKHNCQDAAEIVREQSLNIFKPSPSQENLRCNENNLDLGLQASSNDQEPQFNISSDTERVIPGRSGSVEGGNPLNLGLPGSFDDNISVPAESSISSTWDSMKDEGKRTQAVTAVDDPGNLKSRLPPEEERAKLVRDRVGQHAYDQGNLDSFRDIGKPSEQNKNIQTGDQPGSHEFGSVGALQQPGLFQPQQQQGSSNSESQSEIGSQSEDTRSKESHILSPIIPGRSGSVEGGNPLNLGLPGSFDDNISVPAESSNSSTWDSMKDDGKRTQAVTAVDDPGNLKSRLPPEEERAKLLRDRVGQHANDQGNLDSFRDIGKPSEQNKNIQTGDQPCSHEFGSVGALQPPGLLQPQQQQGSSNTESQTEIGSQSEETSRKESHIVNPSNYREHLDSYQKLHRNTSSSSIGLSVSALTLDDTDGPDRVGSEGRNVEEKETNN